jgi:hypothetical protein
MSLDKVLPMSQDYFVTYVPERFTFLYSPISMYGVDKSNDVKCFLRQSSQLGITYEPRICYVIRCSMNLRICDSFDIHEVVNESMSFYVSYFLERGERTYIASNVCDYLV